MKTIHFFTLLLILETGFVLSSNAQVDNSIFQRWAKTDALIWDNKISRDAAVDSIALYVPIAVKYCRNMGVHLTESKNWVFPLRGFTKTSYRRNGNDYSDKRFDYFQGGESHDHPAHDIFILDNDSNTVEDSTGKKVDAVSMTSGVVFNTIPDWKPGDFGRGGNSVKVFDPESEAMFYYSHLDTVTVHVGDIVKAGDKIGVVGRTGRKAIHGKTHLHIAYYPINDGEPEPENIIDDIFAAEKRARK
jgi:peptidoglycan LD-endopeptidase LytH